MSNLNIFKFRGYWVVEDILVFCHDREQAAKLFKKVVEDAEGFKYEAIFWQLTIKFEYQGSLRFVTKEDNLMGLERSTLVIDLTSDVPMRFINVRRLTIAQKRSLQNIQGSRRTGNNEI